MTSSHSLAIYSDYIPTAVESSRFHTEYRPPLDDEIGVQITHILRTKY